MMPACQAVLLITVLLAKELLMTLRTRSDTPISELVQSLEGDAYNKKSALYFIRDFPDDVQLVLPTLVKLLQGLGEDADYDHLSSCLAAAGEPAITHLIEALQHRHCAVQGCAADAMEKMARRIRPAGAAFTDHSAVPVLIKPTVPSLIDLAVPALIERFTDDDPNVTQKVLEAIAAIGPEAKQAIPAAIKVLIDPSAGRCRASAAYALEHIGPAAKDAIPALLALVRDEKGADEQAPYARYHSIRALGNIGPDAAPAVPTLVALLKQNAETGPEGLDLEQSAAIQALGSIGTKSQEVLAALKSCLDMPDAIKRVDAAGVLGRLDPGNLKALDLLTRELQSDDKEIRGRAALELGACGPLAKAALPRLRAMMVNDPDEDNRSFAEGAIEKITATLPSSP